MIMTMIAALLFFIVVTLFDLYMMGYLDFPPVGRIARIDIYGYEDKQFATAKAITRKCSVYLFKENWK